jgi:hydroxypyruvate reductase
MKRFSGLHTLAHNRQEQVWRVCSAALAAADPAEAVSRALTFRNNRLAVAGVNYDDLRAAGKVLVCGVGKAALAMARGLVSVLGDRISGGLLVTKHVEANNGGLPKSFQVIPGGHPVPAQESVTAAEKLAAFLQGVAPGDLVIFLISGGGSALLTYPQKGIALSDLQQLTRLLLSSGADITEMNTLRKHLDRVKGGGLARLAAPARVLTLILSDVIGSPLDVIASGPTVADPTTYVHALAILEKYDMTAQVPPAVLTVLRQGEEGRLVETLKAGDPLLSRVQNLIVASNPQAAQAGLDRAQREGFHSLLLTTYLQGEASQVGGVLAALLKQIDASGQPIPRPACLIAGGETTVTLRGSGMGGRNQELALGAVPLLAGIPDVALVTLGTDGEDGPTDAAGALVTGDTLDQARQMGLDPLAFLRNNDSYHFFDTIGGLIRTGPTGTNVNDLAFLFAF